MLRDPGGTPLPEEGVAVWRTGHEDEPPLAVAQTNAVGTARLTLRAPGPWTVFRVRPDGNDLLATDLTADQIHFEARVAPTPRRKLDLQIRRDDADPPAYAEVELWTPGSNELLARAYVARGMTDANGQVTVHVPSDGPWDIRVLKAPATAWSVLALEAHLDWWPAGAGLATVTVHPGRSVRCTLTYDDGTPCSHAHVSIRQADQRAPTVDSRTNAMGELVATFAKLPKQPLDALVSLPGDPHHHLVRTLEGGRPHHTLRLPPLVTVEGRVRAPSDTAPDQLPPLVLQAAGDATALGWSLVPFEVRVEADGTFRFENVPAALPITVDVGDDPLDPSPWCAPAPPTAFPAGRTAPVVMLERRETLAGRVSLFRMAKGVSYAIRATPLRPGASPRSVALDLTGRFRLPAVAPGPQRVQLVASRRKGWTVLTSLDLESATSEVRLVMPSTRYTTLSLHRPSSGASVELAIFKAGTSELVAALTTSGPRTSLHLADGRYDIAAQARNTCAFARNVAAGDSTLLDLRGAAWLDVSINDAPGLGWDRNDIRFVARGPSGTWPLRSHGIGFRGQVAPGSYELLELRTAQPDRVAAKAVEAGSILLELESE
ncbi:MAG: hypothetical protein R3F05_00365 [Planctomycetota bacterium]